MDLASITEARLSDSTTCDVGILGAVGRFLDMSESGGGCRGACYNQSCGGGMPKAGGGSRISLHQQALPTPIRAKLLARSRGPVPTALLYSDGGGGSILKLPPRVKSGRWNRCGRGLGSNTH